MKVIGLTGSIGMGKSTVAAMLEANGVPVFDADRAVHHLYAGPLAAAIEAAFPGTTVDGTVDRTRLAAAVVGNPQALARLEAIVHPAVRAEERAFRDGCQREGRDWIALDIPLLFETGRMEDVDLVLVVSAPEAVQRTRVLARPGMTAEKLAAILGRQMPDAEKRVRADVVLDTGGTLDWTAASVAALVALLRAGKTPPKWLSPEA